ncbi:dTMP kinase [Micromonospora sp. NBC_01813]|uniref:dTMP kinase n=1 Tax=Micromonospora sp. NBC_01813 TaxID=2975988 RepID=UPI002DDC47A5|nr:AAA family ATPase [Micromonospora sp. NBC_01813]WSA06858.1 AAA family ATPase [Micromonospora sp. NBC_01813]
MIPNQAQTALHRGKLIAVTGIDGAGKSTLAASLHEAYKDAGHEALLIGKRTVDVPSSRSLSQYLDAVNAVVYRRDASVGQASGDRYWLFALAAWYTLQDQLVIRPALQTGVNVILDNTYHKILARYSVNPEVPTDLARQVFADLTRPDVVVFLHLPADEALRRKQQFTPLEAGRTGAEDEHFIAYQDHVTQALLALADESWASIDVSAKKPDVVLDEVLAMINDRRALALA